MRNLILTCCVFWFGLAAAAHAEKRVALVIGNSAYERISPLANPKNDAELMVRSLKEVGFEVVVATDVDYRGMRRAVRDFGRTLRKAGKNAVGLFYYAGHGVQARGANYLVPIGADIQDSADLEIEALSASDILVQMEAAGNRLNLVLLDACRNNPFGSKVRSATRGLARIQAASGTLISFAAAPGQVAADGTGRNSPYTLAFVDAIRSPGLSVEHVFKRVRSKVEAETGGAQTPWEESSLKGDFYFTPKKAEPVAKQEPVYRADREALFWETIKDTENPVLLQTYLDRYPGGTFAGLAKAMIAHLNAKEQKRQDELAARLEAERQARKSAEKARHEAERKLRERIDKIAKASPPSSDTSILTKPQTSAEMVLLARRYEAGDDGLKEDLGKAVNWYGKAADKGNAVAQYRLGRMAYEGRGMAKNPGLAARLILASVETKYEPAVAWLLERENALERPFVVELQKRLKQFGYYRSRIDGRIGPGTLNALKELAGIAHKDPVLEKAAPANRDKASPAGKTKRSDTPRKKARRSGAQDARCERRRKQCKLTPYWNLCTDTTLIRRCGS